MPGPIHGVLPAGSSHIHLGVGEAGRGKLGWGGEKDYVTPPTPSPFPALLLKDKTPNKMQTQEDNYKGNSQVTQWIANSWKITEKLCLPLVSNFK